MGRTILAMNTNVMLMAGSPIIWNTSIVFEAGDLAPVVRHVEQW